MSFLRYALISLHHNELNKTEMNSQHRYGMFNS